MDKLLMVTHMELKRGRLMDPVDGHLMDPLQDHLMDPTRWGLKGPRSFTVMEYPCRTKYRGEEVPRWQTGGSRCTRFVK